MPQMEMTPGMVNAMRDVLADKSLQPHERNLLEQYGPTAKSLPMEVIELLRRKKKVYLHELLAGSSVTPPDPLPEKKKNPEAEERLFKIKAQLEDREYEMMTRDIRRQEIEQQDAGEIKTMSQSIGEGVNILVAKGTAFAIGWFASRAAWGYDPLWNMISGLVGLILGFMIESLLFVLRSSSAISRKERQQRRDGEMGELPRKTNAVQVGMITTAFVHSVQDLRGAAEDEISPMLSRDPGPLSPTGTRC